MAYTALPTAKLCFICELVTPCKAEATTRQRATSGFQPLIHLLFAECLAKQYQIPDFVSLVRPGRGFEPMTLSTGVEHSTISTLSLKYMMESINKKDQN